MAAVAPWLFLAPWWRALQAHDLAVVSRHRDFREELQGLSVSIWPVEDWIFEAADDDDGDGEAEADAGTNATVNNDDDGDATPPAPLCYPATVRDALELALLLSIADRKAFEEFVGAAVDESTEADARNVLEWHADDALRHVQLKFTQREPDAAILHAIVRALAVFVTPQPLEDRDAGFQEARRLLLAQIPASETDKLRACEQLKITVRLSMSYLVPPLELMRVVEAAEAVSSLSASPYPFVSGDFEVYVQESTFIPDTTAAFNRWHERGMRPPFDRVVIKHEDWRSLPHFGKALSAVFQPKSSAEVLPTVDVTVTSFDDPERFVQVCSAIMHSRHVRSLSVSLHLSASERRLQASQARRQRMRWVIFALFSHWATHTIHELNLDDVHLEYGEPDDLFRLLKSDNPLPLLFDGSASFDAAMVPVKQVLASKNAKLRLDLPIKRRNAGERDSIRLLEQTWLDVISQDAQDDGGWLVLVPAYGKCRLGQADTLEERTLEFKMPADEDFVNRGITSMKLHPPTLHNGDGRGIFAFLRIFGRQLETLTLRNVSQWVGEELLVMLMDCVSVKRLHLPSSDPSVLPILVRAYETGVCKASLLDLRYLSDNQRDSPHVIRFFNALADSRTTISLTVRELLFSNGAIRRPICDEEMQATRTMLARNHTLEYFERTCQPVHNPEFVALSHECSDANASATSLPPQAKAAFLSVLSSGSSSTVSSVPLDSVMISRIFDMAAFKRRVIIGSYRSMYYR